MGIKSDLELRFGKIETQILSFGLIQQTENWWYLFYFSQRNNIWHFMQSVSVRDNLHEMSNPVSWENKKNILSYYQKF